MPTTDPLSYVQGHVCVHVLFVPLPSMYRTNVSKRYIAEIGLIDTYPEDSCRRFEPLHGLGHVLFARDFAHRERSNDLERRAPPRPVDPAKYDDVLTGERRVPRSHGEATMSAPSVSAPVVTRPPVFAPAASAEPGPVPPSDPAIAGKTGQCSRSVSKLPLEPLD